MKHTLRPVRFDQSNNRDFQSDLRQRVQAYLKENGSKATASMWVRVVVFIAAYWIVWASLAFVEHSLLGTLGLLVLFALCCVSLAYTVSHDAVHNALSDKPWVNELLFQGTFTPMGPNGYLWRLRHKVVHHNCVNIPGFDFNIEASDILRFAPTQQWRPIHRYQHIYAPVAYLVFTLHWVFIKDLKMLGMKNIGILTEIEHSTRKKVEVLAWKAVYVAKMLVIPTLVLSYSFWQVLLGYLFFQFVVSFLFVITFVASHLNEGVVFVEHDEGDRVPLSFFEHQIRTSIDFHPTNPVVSFFFGGFNGHVAHHCFPTVCSVHYPAITRIIQAVCAEHGVPYQERAMLPLFRDHFRFLRDLGQAEHSGDRFFYVDPEGETFAAAAK